MLRLVHVGKPDKPDNKNGGEDETDCTSTGVLDGIKQCVVPEKTKGMIDLVDKIAVECRIVCSGHNSKNKLENPLGGNNSLMSS